MKQPYNLKAAAATRAVQIATCEFKSKWKDEGRKLKDFCTSDHRSAITKLANNPTIFAKAMADVERWKKRSANTA